MTYLIAQIWLFIAVAAAVGLLFGWMFRGGVSSARLRELRHSLAHAEAEAADQRREAAELAARAERWSGSGGGDSGRLHGDLSAAREKIARLETEVREAARTADRYAEEAEELRHRMADLMSRSGGAGADERAAWRARMGELEEEAESLRRLLSQRDSEATEALRKQIADLEAECDALRERAEQLEARREREADGAARAAELEREVAALRERLAEAAEGSSTQAEVRVGELEAECEALRRRLEDVEQAVAEPLRVRIYELEGALETAQASLVDEGAAARHAAAQEVDKLHAEIDRLREELAERDADAREIEALRADVDRLRDELARRDAEARELDAMRARIGELETDLDISRTRAAEAEAQARRGVAEGGGRGRLVPAEGGEDDQMESARLKWRNSYLTSRIHFLESQLREEEERRGRDDDGDGSRELAAAREEIARLSARVAELERGPPDRSDQPAPNVEGGGGSLEWRNRYLASRVRYLEQRLEEGAASGEAMGDEELRLKLAQAQEDLKEMAKLRARVSELEREMEHVNGADEEGRSEGDRALEWRIRYLSSRVKYLEDRLSKAGLPPEGPEGG